MAITITKGPGALSKMFTNLGTMARKNSPELLVIGGTLAFAATIFATYKATVKTREIVDAANESVEQINKCKENGYVSRANDASERIEYTEEDADKDIKAIKRQSAGKIIKATIPVVLLGATTLSCFFGADYIRKQRHAALFAASEVVMHSYENYRKGVIERFGPDVDRELKYKLFKEEVETEEVNPDTGRKKKSKKTVYRTNYDGYSDFARMFDEFNDLYQKNVSVNGKEPSYGVYNLKLLVDIERQANEKLRNKGFLTLNEVYEMLHYDVTIEGRDAGWIFDLNDETCRNGTHISFGILNGKTEDDVRALLLGNDSSIILDFNVDTLDVWHGFDDTPTFGLLPGRRR